MIPNSDLEKMFLAISFHEALRGVRQIAVFALSGIVLGLCAHVTVIEFVNEIKVRTEHHLGLLRSPSRSFRL